MNWQETRSGLRYSFMEPVFFKIDTEIPPSYTEKLLDFMDQKYLLPQKDRFASISRKKAPTGTFLSYAILETTRSKPKPTLC